MYDPGNAAVTGGGGIAGGAMLAVSGVHWWLPSVIAVLLCAALLFAVRGVRTRVRTY